jgi:hypothetical protein
MNTHGKILQEMDTTGASETTEYGLGEKVILTLANPFLLMTYLCTILTLY